MKKKKIPIQVLNDEIQLKSDVCHRGTRVLLGGLFPPKKILYFVQNY